MTLRVGVAGTGIGVAHVKAFQALGDRFVVAAVADVDAARAAAVAAEHGVPTATTEFEALCTRRDVEVVDLCTPSHLHMEQTLMALAAGKHVICEKPVAASHADLDRLEAAERASGCRVMPVFQNRFGSGVRTLKRLVDLGVTGRGYVATAETSWRRRADYYGLWRGSKATELGGALTTLGIHQLDVLTHVLGTVEAASAFLATRVNAIETEDCVAASLRLADGSLASLTVTTGSAAQTARMRFTFANLCAESPVSAYGWPGQGWRFTGDSPAADADIARALEGWDPGLEFFEGQFAAYHRALADGTELPVTLEDARRTLTALQAIYTAAL